MIHHESCRGQFVCLLRLCQVGSASTLCWLITLSYMRRAPSRAEVWQQKETQACSDNAKERSRKSTTAKEASSFHRPPSRRFWVTGTPPLAFRCLRFHSLSLFQLRTPDVSASEANIQSPMNPGERVTLFLLPYLQRQSVEWEMSNEKSNSRALALSRQPPRGVTSLGSLLQICR